MFKSKKTKRLSNKNPYILKVFLAKKIEKTRNHFCFFSVKFSLKITAYFESYTYSPVSESYINN